jgi:L-threonylcarbamoyladenylate synthase
MKYRHYAPNARVILLDGNREAIDAMMSRYRDREDVALLCYADDSVANASNARILGAFDRRDQQARNLFDLLRSFDSHSEIKQIYAPLPDRKGIGLALFNRMLKAAGYEIETV